MATLSRIKIDFGELRSNLSAAWVIAKKDARIYYLRAPTLMFGIMFPFVMFLSFAIGRSSPIDILIPGLVAMTIFFSASSIGPVSIPLERRVKTFERLLSAPISFYAVFLGKVLAGLFFSLAIGAIPIVVGITFFGSQIVNVVPLIIGFVLPAFCFSTLGIMFASYPTENPGDVMMLLNFVRLPLIFISGLFISVESLPGWGQVAATFSPLTYANDLVGYALEGKTTYGPVLDSIVLLLFTGIFLLIGMRLEKKFRK